MRATRYGIGMRKNHLIQRASNFLAKPDILFFCLPWLMVLLIVGTIAQKYMGIYEAQKIFFSSWIFFWGVIPLPGGALTLGIIFVSLAIKFIFHSPWSFKKAGIILTHLGILTLLLGGLITAKYAEETFMVIPEGEYLDSTSVYRERTLTLMKNDQEIEVINFANLKKGTLFENALPFSINADFICENCTMSMQNEERSKNAHGLAKKVELVSAPLEQESEGNLGGVMIVAEKTNLDGRHLLMESVADSVTFINAKDKYTITIGRLQRPLPFSIELIDFRKINYPGTNKAKSFESDIIIHDGDVNWPITIRMNEPARYKGYTFFQSSFVERPNQEITVLNVVHNIGQVFPYISSLIIFIGLLLHSFIRLQNKRRKNA